MYLPTANKVFVEVDAKYSFQHTCFMFKKNDDFVHDYLYDLKVLILMTY